MGKTKSLTKRQKRELVEFYAKKCDPFLGYRCLSAVRWEYPPHFGGLPTASEFLGGQKEEQVLGQEAPGPQGQGTHSDTGQEVNKALLRIGSCPKRHIYCGCAEALCCFECPRPRCIMDETIVNRAALRRLEVMPLARQGLRPREISEILVASYDCVQKDFQYLKRIGKIGDGNGKRR